jgi:putative nucleotidyltransferase with HDIG domain
MPVAADRVRSVAEALARAVDAKDSYTRSHCQMVSDVASRIATDLGFSSAHVDQVRLAGLLHDVGKIGVADAILHKPGPLDAEEMAIMETHSTLGERIVQGAGLDEVGRWIRHHHERLDGSGYPDGLAGAEIPIESRIVLVADAFEAMTADRPYRRGQSVEWAISELRRHVGTQFDERCVAAAERVFLEQGVQAPSASRAMDASPSH